MDTVSLTQQNLKCGIRDWNIVSFFTRIKTFLHGLSSLFLKCPSFVCIVTTFLFWKKRKSYQVHKQKKRVKKSRHKVWHGLTYRELYANVLGCKRIFISSMKITSSHSTFKTSSHTDIYKDHIDRAVHFNHTMGFRSGHMAGQSPKLKTSHFVTKYDFSNKNRERVVVAMKENYYCKRQIHIK